MANLSLPSNPEPQHNSYQEVELKIANERLRQARRSFNLAFYTTAACSTIALGGATLLLCGAVSEGALAAAGGAVSITYCLQFAKDANDRLDKIAKELREQGMPRK